MSDNNEDENSHQHQKENHKDLYHDESKCDYIDIRLPIFLHNPKEIEEHQNHERSKRSDINEILQQFEIVSLEFGKMTKLWDKKFQK